MFWDWKVAAAKAPMYSRLLLGSAFIFLSAIKLLLPERTHDLFMALFGSAGAFIVYAAILLELCGGVALITGWKVRIVGLVFLAHVALLALVTLCAMFRGAAPEMLSHIFLLASAVAPLAFLSAIIGVTFSAKK